MKRVVTFILLAVLGLSAALSTPALSMAESVEEVNVTMTEFAFDPAQINVTQGQPVRFMVKNAGNFPHNVTFVDPSNNSKQNLFATNLTAGESRTAEFTFQTAGNWYVYCPVGQHEERGMKGSAIVVQAAAPGQLPRTGGSGIVLPLIGLVGLTLLSGGILMLRRLQFHRS